MKRKNIHFISPDSSHHFKIYAFHRYRINKLIIVFITVFLSMFQNQSGLKGQKYVSDVSIGYWNGNEKQTCISREERNRLIGINKNNIGKLKFEGKIRSMEKSSANPVKFIWPVRAAGDYYKYNFYSVSVFPDHDPAADSILDYNNGQRTYDGHNGTDIVPWPYPWYQMDHDEMEIVAAEDGIIIGKSDGYFDRSCEWSDTARSNYISVLHENNLIAWYFHFKKNSVTSKDVGDSVKTGEFLGIAGSSGISTGPHLHFELLDTLYNSIDPYAGPANNTTEDSWWEEQNPYFESRVNEVSSHFPQPVFRLCPEQEVPNIQNEFTAGDTVYLTTFFQDILDGQITNYKILSPGGNIWYEWDFTFEYGYHYPAFYLWFYIIHPTDAETGEWTLLVDYEEETYEHNFHITSPTDIEQDDPIAYEFNLFDNYPNPFNPTTTIEYSLPKEVRSEKLKVSLSIYDILGKEVATLVNKEQQPGHYEVKWDAVNISSGVYLYKLTAGNFTEVKKMVLLR